MCTYDEDTLAPSPFQPPPGEREHILVVQDESVFHVNDQSRSAWLSKDESVPLRQKGNGRAVHVSDFLCEKSDTGRLNLTTEQITAHALLPDSEQLKTIDARKIIYPGKGKDDWWDLKQLQAQTTDAVKIFEHLFPSATGVFVFDCSSAHEAFSEDALNVNRMNLNPGGKNCKRMHDTVIPDNIPSPQHTGIRDMRGQVQAMTFPDDHPDLSLRGKVKGIFQILRERESVWYELTQRGKLEKPVGICGNCRLSASQRDAQAHIARAEEAGQDANLTAETLETADLHIIEDNNKWCCAKRVLSMQRDFVEEKPQIQLFIESQGHKCLFLPRFHCELNAIELYWGFAKYSKFVSILLFLSWCLTTPVFHLQRISRNE